MTTASAEPLPLSFPAILRNPKLPDRFAHLRVAERERVNEDRPEPGGKRWVRRRENAKFTHNPHIALPTTLDLAHPLQLPLPTFPHPLPPYLPRSVPVPASRPPPSLPDTSSAGLFSLSLRGARRTLRARPFSAYLVKAIETHLAAWLQGGTYLNPDQEKGLLRFPGDPIDGRGDIREVAREAGRLVWAVKADHDGAFERYVVHCVARWYGVVSFSKDTDGHRLTYLLRPNVTRPDPRASAASPVFDTPPTTDASDFHVSDATLSDFNNTTDASTDASDIDSLAGDLPTSARSLSDIEESHPSSPASWSVLGGSDFVVDLDNDADDPGFTASMESLSLSDHADPHDFGTPSADMSLTPTRFRDAARAAPVENPMPSRARARADRDRLSVLYHRSTSSPSPARRSPHRKSAARRKRKAKNDKKGFAGAVGTNKGTFYDYLFA